MAPAKAVAWPASIYDDADVLSVDRQGRFIICRACAESFAARGGKTPKPVTMNACFRLRAWETHKKRTRAHRKTTRCSNSSARMRIPSRSEDPSELPSERPAQTLLFLQQAVAARRTEMTRLNLRYAHCTDDLVVVNGPHVQQEQRPTSSQHQLASETRSSSAYYHLSTASGTNHTETQTVSPISKRPHGLGRILNPMSTTEAMDCDKPKLQDRSNQLRRRADKRQRPPHSGKDSGPDDAERSATHAMYWNTMRELFSHGNGHAP